MEERDEALDLVLEAAEVGASHAEGCGDQGRVEDWEWAKRVRAACEQLLVERRQLREALGVQHETNPEPWTWSELVGAVKGTVDAYDELRREICDAAGKSWAYPMVSLGDDSWQRAYEQGRRNEAKRRGWDGLYE